MDNKNIFDHENIENTENTQNVENTEEVNHITEDISDFEDAGMSAYEKVSKEIEKEKEERAKEEEKMADKQTVEQEIEKDIPVKKVKFKKRNSFAKRAVALVASAAVFGCVAGGTMVGVNKVAQQTGFVSSGKKVALGSNLASTGDVNSATTTATTENDSTTTSTLGSTADVSKIVEKAMPSVVAINGTQTVKQQNVFGRSQSYQAESSGSGIIIGENDEELLIVTNNHVIADTDSLSVVFVDNKEVKASVKGGDADNDIAVISVKLSDIPEETRKSITLASIGNSDNVKVGQGVVAIGNALGYGQSVTVGYISALNREVKTDVNTSKSLMQTDAAINPGNSGGALLNMNGEVIGINSAKYSSTQVEGMGYAIPISKVQDIITSLSNKPTRTVVAEDKQGLLGIQGQDINDEISKAYDIPKGVYVYKIVENGAAAKSELQEKDVITKIDGDSVSNMEGLKKKLTYYASGEKVTLTVQRLNGSKYEEKQVEVTLGSKADMQQSSGTEETQKNRTNDGATAPEQGQSDDQSGLEDPFAQFFGN
jgi:peptidase S1 and S6 chymotrypsin/hap